MTPDTAAAYGEGYELGHAAGLADGRQQGAQQARGAIVHGLTMRAVAHESAAAKARTIGKQYAHTQEAGRLRDLATEIRNGEL